MLKQVNISDEVGKKTIASKYSYPVEKIKASKIFLLRKEKLV